MAKLNVKQIQDEALVRISANPGGIRYSDLVNGLHSDYPDTPKNTIHGAVWNLGGKYPSKVTKPSRGLFVPTTVNQNGASVPLPSPVTPVVRAREEDFYEPFAEWLKNELDEATVAISLGGAGMQKKWGTPDVVGVYKPLASHRIKFDIELISAEIKIDPLQPVVAFGQAAAYRLFSAKSYVVMPKSISEEDYSRLEALCILFGIGLVLFKVDVENPDFVIKVRAQRYSPDMFYVNEFAERIFQMDPNLFNTLFG